MARYWVGGSGNVSDTAHWSTTSGGAGGASVPNSGEDAIFDAASNTTAYTVTVDASMTCLNLNFSAAPSVSGTITLAGSSPRVITVWGHVTMLAGMTNSFTGTVSMVATSGTKVITSNAIGFAFIVIAGSGGTFQLADNLVFNIGGPHFRKDAGTFDPNGKTVTFNAGSMFIDSALNFYDLTITGTAAKTGSIRISGDITVSNTFTVNGNSLINRLLVNSLTAGTPITITAAVVSMSNVDFMDVTGAGAGTWTGTSIGNALGNSGITFTTPVTRYWVGNTNSWSSTSAWSASSGGASGASVPLCHDTVIFDVNSCTSSGRTITIDMPRVGADVTMTSMVNNPGLSAATSWTLYGSLALSAGMQALTGAPIFAGRSSHTITMNGCTLRGPVVGVFGGTFSMLDAMNTSGTGAMVITAGTTFNTNNFNWTSAGSNAGLTVNGTINMGSSVFTFTNSTSAGWIAGAASTINAGTSVIKYLDSTATAKAFAGGGKTYATLWFSGTGTGTFDVTGSNTFTEFKADANLSLRFTAGTTTTAATWTIGNGCTIGSITAAGHTLAKSGGGHVSVYGCTISRSTASPAATFYAAGSTDGGNNVSWTFSGFPYTLSGAAGSFTESGQAASLLYGRRLAADVGAFVLAGQAASNVNLISNPRYVIRRRARNFTIRA